MAGEAEEVQVEQQVEGQTAQSEEDARAAELASVQAGYNRVPGQPPEVNTEEAPAEEAKPEPHEPPQELVDTRKKVEELEGKVNERLQKVFNQLGNLSQKLDTIGKSAPESKAAQAEAKVITADSLKKLKELGFDEIAEALAEDLSHAISGGSDPQTIAKITADAVKQAREEDAQETMRKSVEALDKAHPDRIEIRESTEYAEWLDTLSESKRNRFLNSWNPDYVSDRLDEFKDWRAKQAEAKPTPETPTQTSEKRLENAVTPTTGRSAGSPTRLPDEAGLWAGYNKGRKPFKR